MKTFKFSLVLRTRENTDVFITLDDNIYGIHSKRVNILYIYKWWMYYFLLFGFHHLCFSHLSVFWNDIVSLLWCCQYFEMIFVSLNVLWLCHLNPHCIYKIICISYVCIFIHVPHNHVLVKVEINYLHYLLTYIDEQKICPDLTAQMHTVIWTYAVCKNTYGPFLCLRTIFKFGTFDQVWM